MQNKNFKINNSIYQENFIYDTISAFEEVSVITYNNGILKIYGESEEEIENIFNEFINYVTGLINE